MRQYDDPVEVRRGRIGGALGSPSSPGSLSSPGTTTLEQEGPEQFLWRGRLWLVREVVAHWVETGAWWASAETSDPLAEQELWRVVAARGRAVSGIEDPGFGVFDLALDWSDGSWRLARTMD